MAENKRLSIDEVIAHCNRRVERFESFSSRENCENWSLDSQYGKEYWEHRQVAEWLEEIKVYRAIGTVEECRTAVDRMKPKKPRWHGHHFCPHCNNIVYVNAGKDIYCPKCGQKLDWSE